MTIIDSSSRAKNRPFVERGFSVAKVLLVGALLSTLSFPSLYAQGKNETKAQDPLPVLPPTGKVPADLLVLGDGKFFSSYAMVVDKEQRTLSVWKNNTNNSGLEFVEAFATDIGKATGDKQTNGDFKTPEGIYFFQQMLQGKELNFDEYGQKAFTTDYPNFFDVRKNKSGSGIWLHAIPDTKSLWRGSRGCVVVRNSVIPILEKYILLQKTPVIIRDKVAYISPQEWQTQRTQILDWLMAWRSDWESKNLAKYIENYDETFRALRMNKTQWQKYKASLAEKYQTIQVKIYDPVIYRHQDEIIVRFLQYYESDKISDFGEKSLYVRFPQGKPQIVGEEWRELPRDMMANLSLPEKRAF